MPILTRTLYNQGLSEKGFLRPAQFRALGYDGLFKGWKHKLVGKTYSQEQIDEFLRLKKVRGGSAKEKPENKPKRRSSKNKPDISYKTQLQDKRWIALRKQVLFRDRGRCVRCGVLGGEDGRGLAVHHLLYESGKYIWDVPDWYLVTLCHACHKKEHSKKFTPPRKIY